MNSSLCSSIIIIIIIFIIIIIMAAGNHYARVSFTRTRVKYDIIYYRRAFQVRVR